MNSIDFIQDKDMVLAGLERNLTVNGVLCSNIDFAVYLFVKGRDLELFDAALLGAGYVKEEFDPVTVERLERCLNMGNAHKKAELTRLALSGGTDADHALDMLNRGWNGYMSKVTEDHAGQMSINIMTKTVEAMDEGLPEKTDVIVENEVPDAEEL